MKKLNKLPLYVFKSPLCSSFTLKDNRVVYLIDVSQRSNIYKYAIYDHHNIENRLFIDKAEAVGFYHNLLVKYAGQITTTKTIQF